MDNQTAMRDSDRHPVFVNQDGSYFYTFPESQIVQRDTNQSGYTVYFFVSRKNDSDYVELSYHTNNKDEALDFASEIYGETINIIDQIYGEVFEVEVHNN